jgi:hypothetical protein
LSFVPVKLSVGKAGARATPISACACRTRASAALIVWLLRTTCDSSAFSSGSPYSSHQVPERAFGTVASATGWASLNAGGMFAPGRTYSGPTVHEATHATAATNRRETEERVCERAIVITSR